MKKWISLFAASTIGAYVYKKIVKPALRYKQVESHLIRRSSSTNNPIKFESKPLYVATKKLENRKQQSIRKPQNIWKKIGGVVLGAAILGWFFQEQSYWLSSNVLKSEITFNGTYFPIKRVPIWTDLTVAERGLTYEQMPANKMQNIPDYNPSTFQQGINWTSGNAKARNAYITYSVPYLGSYELNGKEHDGSHPGIDIKAPKGTPVHVYANGIVTKVKTQSTGYGLHVVVAHPNVPDPNNSGKTTTVYSSYAHLSKALVKEGQVVNKGDIIAKVGDTGMTTAHHLHFQLDTADAPFFPYWPFSWDEIQNAGVASYFDAVNQAFGVSKARKYTYNPAEYHVAYKNYKGGSDTLLAQNAAPKPETPKEPVKTVVANNTVDTTKEEKPATKPVKEPETPTQKPTTTVSVNPYSEILFETGAVFLKGDQNIIRVSTNDVSQFETPVKINSTLKSLAKISPAVLSKGHFKNGMAELTVTTNSSSSFRLVAEGSFGEVESKLIKPLVFLDIAKGDRYEKAIEFLKNKKVVNGYSDGTYRPNENLTRAEAMKLIIESNEMRLMPAVNNFRDVDRNKWYGAYVSTALARNIVNGYEDGSFKPNKSITRAEFVKMAVETSDLNLSAYKGSNYTDIESKHWSTPYMRVAKAEQMFESSDGKVWPKQTITRAEAAYVIWKIYQAEQS